MSNLLGLLVLLAMCGTAVADERVGGYSDIPVGAHESALLTTALADDTHYWASVTHRLCYATIESLRAQVVAGMLYNYTAAACEVASGALGQGKCSTEVLANCTQSEYSIIVFEQVWTNTTMVISIEPTRNASDIGSRGDTGFATL